MMIATLLVSLAVVALGVQSEDNSESVINDGDTTQYPDCFAVRLAGYRQKGVYRLYKSMERSAVNTFCDPSRNEEDLLIVSRNSDDEDFNRNFLEYERGFVGRRGNYWLGLSAIYNKVQKARTRKLYITMWDWEGKVYSCMYNKFNLGDKESGYQLEVGEFKEMTRGTDIGDMLKYNNGAEFYATGRPDAAGCVSGMHTGWWYAGDHCTDTLPTGHYYTTGRYNKTGPMWDGIFWQGNKGFDYSYKNFRMYLILDY